MKKLTIMMATAALCCCLGSCNSGTKQELANTVHLKGQLLDMGSQNVRMRFDGAASMHIVNAAHVCQGRDWHFEPILFLQIVNL